MKITATLNLEWDYTEHMKELLEEGVFDTIEEIKSEILDYLWDDMNHPTRIISDNHFDIKIEGITLPEK